MIPNIQTLAIAAIIFLALFAGIFFSQAPIVQEESSFIPQSDTNEAISSIQESAPLPTPPIVTSTREKPAPQISNEQKRPVASHPVVFIPPSVFQTPTTTEEKKSEALPVEGEKSKLPEIDENAIFRAVVKIQCFAADGIGRSIGSGFVLKDGLVVTVAHLLMDSGAKSCDVIFPKDRFPIHYLKGEITEDFSVIRKRFEEDGIDIGFLRIPVIAEYADARMIFGDSYPSIPYPVCTDSSIIGDTVYHYGYPSNFKDLNYLSRMEGVIISYADIQGASTQTPADGGASYRVPDFSFTDDESGFHPYAVSQVGIFYGSSGGLAFNASRACILGVNHGFGKGSTATYSIFLSIGWKGAGALIP